MASSRRPAVLVAAALIASAYAVFDRDRVVAAAPRSAAVFAALGIPVNLDHLEIGRVQAALRFDSDVRTLVVNSEISNPRHVAAAAPLLRLSIRDAAGATLYTWTTSPGVKSIAAGARIPVRARLTAPPAGQDVVIEFAREKV